MGTALGATAALGFFPASAAVRVFGGEAGCPFCRIDAVLPDAAGLSLDRDFLLAMRQRWYGEYAEAISGPLHQAMTPLRNPLP
jgi:hypothetical protein